VGNAALSGTGSGVTLERVYGNASLAESFSMAIGKKLLNHMDLDFLGAMTAESRKELEAGALIENKQIHRR
jgi:hypothetical protein